jgi:hypothetical protein
MRPSLCTKKRCASITRFYEHGNINDIYQAISLYRETLTLYPPGHPCHGISLGNCALTRYGNLHVSKDLDEAIDQYRECLQLLRLGHPEHPVTLRNLSSALCSHFMQTQEMEMLRRHLFFASCHMCYWTWSAFTNKELL